MDMTTYLAKIKIKLSSYKIEHKSKSSHKYILGDKLTAQ
jgi:hypothetical protein